ncbi:LysR family transcriptional regulator [Salinicola corii]|uniref:LysR family transcriptional regulator n=1 Tax=Salinicola corii TaxID=2606937 RepID=A0A640WJC2_9GAMM|nr:LysR family transcriptional regulator [Salinicola corii]KAA0020641.1 LysR family transcriptional regulator [Salinicola corii]
MDRNDLHALQTFVTIADQGSLRAAARVLGVNPPAVSHQLKAFETRLGVPLFARSTRSVALTQAGRALYEGSSHLLGALGETLENTRNAAKARSGRLRITLPFRAWQLIMAPKIAAFHSAYPGIELDLTIEEGLTDVIANGFHAGIRLGDHLQDNMVAIRLSAAEETAYVAAPEYLHRHGTPHTPEDLLHHPCIRYRQPSSGKVADWQFFDALREFTMTPRGTLIFNDFRSVVDAAAQGLGIGWSLKRGVQDELQRGTLIQVLAEYTPTRPGFFLYFPKQIQDFGLLRAFIEHFRAD